MVSPGLSTVPAVVTVAGLVAADGVRAAVDALLDDFLKRKVTTAVAKGLPEEVPCVLKDFLRDGGKRIRPALCVLGWQAGGGGALKGAVVQVAASLEMFHAFALIHDDLMDHSDIRRGKPSVHRRLAARHHEAGRTREEADMLGAAGALLVGDVALAWAGELLHSAGLPARRLVAALARTDRMRTEVMYGQYMDLLATGRPNPCTTKSLKIARYKTAGYTIEHPMLLGAELAGADQSLVGALTAYGRAAGEAFQLRDDLLGVFGRPDVTGKPNLDDLREGKQTLLLSLAYRMADPAQLRVLRRYAGDPLLDEHGAARLREVLRSSGAQTAVEQQVETRSRQAVEALQRVSLPLHVAEQLRNFAQALSHRPA
ncbi:polyprenyl synthetase family protein [Streptomyces sp. L2]|uniref:polyprenyl synthetase family protein n=1 Tax=Streptomyces sp. L2 TaxID=2162665 RepID=UPI0010123AD1|nr:polyprenyl synthetase family protein [Streptomyces sp. L2]